MASRRVWTHFDVNERTCVMPAYVGAPWDADGQSRWRAGSVKWSNVNQIRRQRHGCDDHRPDDTKVIKPGSSKTANDQKNRKPNWNV